MSLQPGVRHSPDVFPEYTLTDAELSMAAGEFLEANQGLTVGRFACHEVAANNPVANVGRTIEARVFGQKFPDNTPDFLAKAYNPYESASRFFISFDTEALKPVGVIRAISASEAGLLSVNDMAQGNLRTLKGKQFVVSQKEFQSHHNLDGLDEVWDIGTAAVQAAYQRSGARAGLQLYRALYSASMQNGIRGMVTMADRDIHTQLVKWLHVPFKPEPGCRHSWLNYMDSAATKPLYGEVAAFYPQMDRFRRSLLGRAAIHARPRLGSALNQLMDGADGMDDSIILRAA